jgi:formylglycine-generating enzyme required for sulfatase activity
VNNTMARDYGTIGRRQQSAGWQWFAFGFIMGIILFGCLVATFFGAVAFSIIEVPGVAIGPTEQAPIQIITATPQPATATPLPSETPLPSPTTAAVTEAVVVPNPTEDTGLSLDNPPIGSTPQATLPGSVQVADTPTPAAVIDPSNVAGSDEGDTGSTGGLGVQPVQPQSADTGGIPAVLDILRSDTIDVPGGSYQMGTTITEGAEAVRECTDVWGGLCQISYVEDSSPVHTVQVSTFEIERTEVTYEQYIAFLNFMGPRSHLNGCDGQPCLATRNETDTSNVSFDSQTYDVNDVINNLPVVNVSWYGASAYCEAIGRRLPTEAEWEFAARGTDGRVYPWGNGPFDPSFAKTNRPVTDNPLEIGKVPVGTYPTGASPYGVLDMAGNVAEWVNDWYSPSYYSLPEASGLDPQGPLGGTERVVRGGSWDSVPFFSRSVHRQSAVPNSSEPWLGFRCAADPGADEVSITGNESAAGNQTIPAQPVTPDASVVLPQDAIQQGGNGSSEEQPLATQAP